MIDTTELWIVIAGLGVGSFVLRYVFLGLIGDAPLPGRALPSEGFWPSGSGLSFARNSARPSSERPEVQRPSGVGSSSEVLRKS